MIILSLLRAYHQWCYAETAVCDKDTVGNVCSHLQAVRVQQQHLSSLSTFSSLISLATCADQAHHSCLPGCLTLLTNLQTLSAIHFPTIPTAYCSLSLKCLLIAPTTNVQHDLTNFPQLQSLGRKLSHRPTHFLLPHGQNVCLQHLVTGKQCVLHRLDAATSLTKLELQLMQIHHVGPQL